MNLNEVLDARLMLLEKEKKMYLTAVNQINSQMKELLNNDFGTQFVKSCGRDLAGELVRTYFDTSDYNITVDQLAERMLNFSYDNEIDPLANNGDVKKLAYNYNDNESSSTVKNIVSDLEGSKVKLFEKETVITQNGKTKNEYKDKVMIQKGKQDYREQRNADGSMVDDYTGNDETFKRNSREQDVSQLDVEHTQALSTAHTYSKYLKEGGEDRIKEFYNSPDNFAMMGKTANQSKGDVKVYEKDSDGTYKKDSQGNKIDITYKASPEEIANAVEERWKTCNAKEKLIADGILEKNEKGEVKVNPSAKKRLIKELKKSQNAESKVILKNTDYKNVAKDAGKHTVNSIGKIIAGQVIYYTMPPLLYEIRMILKEKNMTLDLAMERLGKAKDRICKYVMSKLKVIFKGIMNNGIKKFIKSFFDIIINMVKSTVKKMIKLAKNLVLSTVDAIKIIADKNSSPREKADSIFNLFSVTITTFAIEVLFEYIEKQFGLPEALLLPMQTITTIICTNLVMLILQKADLFDVKYGLLISNIENVFNEENRLYSLNINALRLETGEKINMIINEVKDEIDEIKQRLNELDVYSDNVQPELEKINEAFNMNINFEGEWEQYLGVVL